MVISNNMLEKDQHTWIQVLHDRKDLCEHLEGGEKSSLLTLTNFCISTPPLN